MKLFCLLTILLLPSSSAAEPANNILKKNSFKLPPSIDDASQTTSDGVAALLSPVATASGVYAVTYATCYFLTGFGLADGRNCQPYAMVSVSVPGTVWSFSKAYSLWVAKEPEHPKFNQEMDQQREL